VSAQVIPYVELEEKTAAWPVRAEALELVDQVALELAAALLHDVKALRTEIAESCDPVIKAAHAAHKAAVSQRNQLEAPLVEAERILKRKVGAYTLAQERIAREAAAIEEATRREAERKAAEEARELEAMGEPEMADAVRETAEEAPPAQAPPPPRAAGISSRDVWKAEVTNFGELVLAVARGDVPIAVLKVDTTVLGQQARSLKRELRWPGVRVWNDKGVAVR